MISSQMLQLAVQNRKTPNSDMSNFKKPNRVYGLNFWVVAGVCDFWRKLGLGILYWWSNGCEGLSWSLLRVFLAVAGGSR
ncbi:hypothetical protein Droror1_Dr00027176, partial [Drosera rotundifolia]